MIRDRLAIPYGDLNDLTPSKIQRRMDTVTSNPIDVLRQVAKNYYKSDTILDIGEFKGVCLRVDENPVANEGEGWVARVHDPDESTPRLKSVKIRIPELHAMIPEPAVYGDTPGSHQKLIDAHPSFIAADENVEIPAPGDIVRCDFGNRRNLTDPIYLGKVFSPPMPGAVGKFTPANSFADQKDTALTSKSPPGDKLGSRKNPSSQLPQPGSVLQNGVTNLDDGSLREDEHVNQTEEVSDEIPGNTGIPYVRGRAQEPIPLIRLERKYTVQTRPIFLTREVFAAYLRLYTAARTAGITIQVTSGFRSMEQQRELFRRHGSPRVARPGWSNHQNGTAIDFNTNTSKQAPSRSPEYVWLAKNAHRFGFINTGRTFRNKEPWHWSFVGAGSSAARRDGAIPFQEKIAEVEGRL